MKKTKVFNKNVVLYIVFCFVALFAEGIISFVLSLSILEKYDSVFLYGMYITLRYSALVIVPITLGAALERKNKKVICNVCMLALAAANALCFLICKLNPDCDLYVAFAVAIISGILITVFELSSKSLLYEVTEKENFDRVYPLITAIDNLSCVSNIVGLLIYRVTGVGTLFLISSLVFLASLSVGSLIKVKNDPQIIPKENAYLSDFKIGFRYLADKKVMLYMVLLALFCFLNVGSRQITWLPFYEEKYENGYLWYFLTYGLFSTGLFHASLLLTWKRLQKKNRLKTLYICGVVFCSAEALVLFTNRYCGLPLAYMAGLSYGIMHNIRSVAIFEGIDEDVKTRVIGINNTVTNSGRILGTLSASLLSTRMRLDVLSVIPKAIILVFLLYLIFNQKETMRHFND